MSYFESRLQVNFEDFSEVQKRLKFCEKLGINNVILESQNNLNAIPLNFKQKIKKETHINVYYRLNLRLNNVKEFKKQLKRYHKFSDILSIESLNKEIQLYAAKDSRVDIISFSDKEIIKTLTPGVISLTKQNNSFIEFSLAPIMETNKVLQSKNFRNLYRFMHLARKLKANYIISGNFVDLFNFRHPRAMISICHTLLGFPLDVAKKIFIKSPRFLLERIQKRKDENIEPGVRIIKGGV